MSHRHGLYFLLCGAVLLTGTVAAQSTSATQTGARPGYDIDFIGAPLPDPVMQHAKEMYVLYGCAYCHGMTLMARGEAADLMHSALVGADVDGKTIAALLKAGIPQTAKLSPMPQFSDLSDSQLHDIARYIHYARQLGRHKEIVDARLPAGNVAAGKSTFDQNCASCHATDLNGVGKKYDANGLRDQMLMPKNLRTSTFRVDALNDTKLAEARQRHNSLVENSTPAQVANLIEYLQTK